MRFDELPTLELKCQARNLVLDALNTMEKEQARDDNRSPCLYSMRSPYFYQVLYESEFELHKDEISGVISVRFA